ncbi:MAG: hypothetical protein II059_01750 [Clostridia bacterium]|nr:hypothetical protein [Clostridia bacterium]
MFGHTTSKQNKKMCCRMLYSRAYMMGKETAESCFSGRAFDTVFCKSERC